MREAISNIGHGKVAPDVVPLGVLEDAPDNPCLLSGVVAVHQVAYLVLADIIVPKEIGTAAGVRGDCAHLDSPLAILRRL